MAQIQLRNLTKQWGDVVGVRNFNLDIEDKEFIVLLGPSGCGKTTTMRLVAGLEEPTAGDIHMGGRRINDLEPKDRDVAMVFQNYGLYPTMTVRENIRFPLKVRKVPKEKHDEMINGAARMVELGNLLDRLPKELSGGQRQRIGIARALGLNPEFIVCDEPIAALDVSIQAQVVNLLEDLQEKLGLTYLFISHDLGMIRHISKRVAVMYLGKIVELGPARELYSRSQHPYTKALLSAVPLHDPGREAKRERIILSGDVPSPANPPTGCPFRTRCPVAETRCAVSMPKPKKLGPGHWVACHLVE